MAQVAHNIYTHESKENPTEVVITRITEAYGLGKCPKLVEQVKSARLDVRQNALNVLCEEFRNPANIAGCARAGVFQVIPSYALDEDLVTRERSTRALAIAARDYNGRTAMFEVGFASAIKSAVDDQSEDVRANVYEALREASNVPQGQRALVDALYPAKLVLVASTESDWLKPEALGVLYNTMRNETGLQASLEAGAVDMLIELLGSKVPAVQRGAASTLGFLCFNEMAKILAIQCDGVARLAELLVVGDCDVRAAVLGALMTITTVDAGKRAIIATGAIQQTVLALEEDETNIARLNALKLIASIVAHPDIRSQLRQDQKCLLLIRKLEANSDPMLSKHATIALQAVLWVP